MKRIFTLLLLTLTAFTFKTTAQNTSCNAEFAVQYLNNNTVKFNPVITEGLPFVQHYWHFSDGSPVDQSVSPTHTYALPGTYPVVHTISRIDANGHPVCTQSFTKMVTITAECNLVVDFSWTSTASNPLTIAFQNLSVPLATNDSVTWQFGDNTSSHVVNPVHTYANAGTYNVCLIVKKYPFTVNNPCVRYICKTVVVQTPCNLVADFNWTVTPTNPLRIEFHNLSAPLSTTDSIRWTFGDGTSSFDVNPVHTYNGPGTYTVCLRVKKNNTGSTPCVREICKTVVITQPCNLVVDFNWTVTSTNPLRLEFHNLSVPLAAADSTIWTFGDGTSSFDVNPVHTYANAGTYNVCLIVKKYPFTANSPCVRYTCKTVVVQTPCNLVADFNWTVTATNPLRIEFHNLSVPLSTTDSIRWTFGDGSSSTDVNPVHTYNVAGTYTVCLRVKKNNAGSTPCVREICKTVVITQPCNLVVDFNWTVTATNPLRLEFHNLSVPLAPADSTIWNFGDGSTSFDVNPVHTYANAGTYNVCLIVKKYPFTVNSPCIRYSCKTVVIPVPCNLVVNFSSQPDPNHPLRIKFTNLSTPLNNTDSVRWTFGDGTSVSGLQSDPNVANPTHDYQQPGTYNVCLRVKKNNSTIPTGCIRELCRTIVIPPPCNIPVNFSWHLDSLNNRRVYFTNLTAPPTAGATATWYFGDGSTATSWNAVHEYAQPGRYIVCLKIQFSNTCVRDKCDTIFIPDPVPACTELSRFRFERLSNDYQQYKFIPDYLNTTLQYTWTFGDGTGSHDPIATHRYALPGIYTACLTVWRGPNCASTTCKEVRVLAQLNCDTVHVTYVYQGDSQIPNRIHFYANSNVPIVDQTWTISRLPAGTNTVTLHQDNPTYVFNDTGHYRVCLRAVTLGGCVKEVCHEIYIQQLANACMLQAYPNPTSNLINVDVTLSQPEMIHAYVYSNLNVLVREKHQQGVTGNNIVTINVNDLAAGMYIIKLVYGNRTCYARFQKL